MDDSPYLPLYFGYTHVGDLVREAPGKIRFEANMDASVEFPESSTDMLAFLENLLPEGTRQDWYFALRRLKSPDLFGWLREYGTDNIGFVHAAWDGDGDEGIVRDVTREVEILVGKRQPVVFSKQKSLLPGADLKVALLVRNGRFFVPGKEGLTSHILKYGNELCLNETFCLSLMAKCGIDAAVPEFLCFNGQEALLTKRFDRKKVAGRIIALDQRDFCQELKIMSRFKYSVTHGQIAGILPEADKKRFLSIQLFNIIMGANDDHGKNFSFLRDPEKRLAPAYDVASITVAKRVSLIYRDIHLKLSRPIGGQEDANRLKPAHLFFLADIYGIEREWVCGELERLCREIREKSEPLFGKFAMISRDMPFDARTRSLHERTLAMFEKFVPVQTEKFLRLAIRACEKLERIMNLEAPYLTPGR